MLSALSCSNGLHVKSLYRTPVPLEPPGASLGQCAHLFVGAREKFSFWRTFDVISDLQRNGKSSSGSSFVFVP